MEEINRIFYKFVGVINPRGMLEEEPKSLKDIRLWPVLYNLFVGRVHQNIPCELILGFHSRDETAMLVNKAMAKCRSRFA